MIGRPLSWLFAAALLAGVSYWPASQLLAPGAVLAAWKGAGVALLALWALARGRRWIATVLALGALGDVLLDVAGLTVGALAFLAGHIVAIALYRRHARPGGAASGLVIATAILLVAFALIGVSPTLLYAAALAGMAGAAFASRYPRRFVATGAILFALSDLLIFARAGLLAGSALPGLLIWPLYFAGQALIAWGAAGPIGADERHSAFRLKSFRTR